MGGEEKGKGGSSSGQAPTAGHSPGQQQPQKLRKPENPAMTSLSTEKKGKKNQSTRTLYPVEIYFKTRGKIKTDSQTEKS